MNFLNFKDFSKTFLNFSKFILDLFGFLKTKKSSFYRVLTWQMMRRRSDMSPRGARVCTLVCATVISGLSIQPIIYTLLIYPFECIYFCHVRLYFYLFYSCDVARSESFDRHKVMRFNLNPSFSLE